MTPRVLLLPEGDRKPTREVLSGCSLPEEDEGWTPPLARPRGILDRGVYRDPYSPEGWADFTIVDSRGVTRRKIGMPAADVDEHTVPQMNRWLDRVDPLLKVMA